MLGQKGVCKNLKISEAKYWQIADNWKHYSWAIGGEKLIEIVKQAYKLGKENHSYRFGEDDEDSF